MKHTKTPSPRRKTKRREKETNQPLNGQWVLFSFQNCSQTRLLTDQVSHPYLISLQNPCMKCSWPGMQQQVSIRANGIYWGIFPRLKSLPIDEVVCLKAETDVFRAVLAEPLTGLQVKTPRQNCQTQNVEN